MVLTEKKENILSYQENIAGMKSELAKLRDTVMCQEWKERRDAGGGGEKQ
jgi:hypothetical protein